MYEFKCEACDNIFEELVPIGTEDHECPECGEKGKKGFWSGSGPAIKTTDGFKSSFRNRGGIGTSIDRKKFKEFHEDGIPFGNVPGDEDYKWIEDDTRPIWSGPLP